MPIDEMSDPQGLLKHRAITGDEFWKAKIRDPEELKTRQAEYAQTVPTRSDVIFYESMSGARMMDSPYALFSHLYHESSRSDIHHVWSVRSSNLVPNEFKDDPRVTFVTRGTDAHLYFMALAGFIIGNSVLPEHFVRKLGQRYLNTWHGIAYKALGRNWSSPLGAAASAYSLLQATHVLTPCPFMTESELSRFSLRGVFAGSMAEIGYPRQDLTVNLSRSAAEKLRDSLGLDPTKITVLYAPTWRGNKGTARFDAEQLERDIRALSTLDANVIFQAHHIMLRHIKEVDYGNIILPPANIVTNELLAAVDLLISDYSSIFFDYLVTGKPIVHYLYDYDDYAKERGLLLDRSELPGPIVSTAEELVATVSKLISEPYEPSVEYQRARDRFCPHDDGLASNRTVRWFLDGDASGIKTIEAKTRPSVMFCGGRLDKSKRTRSFLDDVDVAARSGERDVTLFVAHSVKSNPAALDRIRQLDPSVSIVARNDYEMIMTDEEKQARKALKDHVEPENIKKSAWGRLKELLSRKDPQPSPREVVIETMYEREYRRVFGDAKFDEVVEFDGLSEFWRKLSHHAVG